MWSISQYDVIEFIRTNERRKGTTGRHSALDTYCKRKGTTGIHSALNTYCIPYKL